MKKFLVIALLVAIVAIVVNQRRSRQADSTGPLAATPDADTIDLTDDAAHTASDVVESATEQAESATSTS